MDHDIGFVGVGLHLAVLKHVPVNSAWSKTYIWTPRSTFYDARKLSYSSQGHLEVDQDPVVICVIVVKCQNCSIRMCRYTFLLRLPITFKIHQKMNSVIPKNTSYP